MSRRQVVMPDFSNIRVAPALPGWATSLAQMSSDGTSKPRCCSSGGVWPTAVTARKSGRSGNGSEPRSEPRPGGGPAQLLCPRGDLAICDTGFRLANRYLIVVSAGVIHSNLGRWARCRVGRGQLGTRRLGLRCAGVGPKRRRSGRYRRQPTRWPDGQRRLRPRHGLGRGARRAVQPSR